MKMKAALWYGKRDIRVEEVDRPVPSKGEVVVKVKNCGICGTDLHDYTDGPQVIPVDEPNPLTGDKAPIIIGHEFSGEIVELGPEVTGWKVGDRVAIMPLLHCGKCHYCQQGLKHLCELFACTGLQWRWGGFAEYALAKDYQLNKIPDSVTYKQAACIEPASLAMYGVRRSGLKAGDTVLITGGGPIAVLMLMGVLAAGASKVYMSEILETRLNRLERLGATKVFNPLTCNVVDEVLQLTDGLGVDVAFECTGAEAAMNDCFQALKKRGMYVQTGLNVEKVKLNPFDWAFKDLNMVALWAYNTYDFPSTLRLMEAGKLPVENIVTKTIRLEDIVEEGFEKLTFKQTGEEIKIQVVFE